MATRLVHISDLHFAARQAAQVAALGQSILDAAPDLVVVTGDLTRNGTVDEFRDAGNFLDTIAIPKLVVPGNHDVPVFDIAQRLLSPFRRFSDSFGDAFFPVKETDDVLVAGLNTAYGVRLGLDWSLGSAAPRRVAAVAETLKSRRGARLAIVACHHPLCSSPLDAQRSRTAGGEAALETLAEAGLDIVLHGHLHRFADRRHLVAGRNVHEICSTTALSDRERDGTSGYNVLDILDGRWRLSMMIWREGRYQPGTPDIQPPR